MTANPSNPRRFAAPAAGRGGTTLIELMIAIAVLTVGIGAIMSHWATLHGLRATTTNMAKGQAALRALEERLRGWDAYALGAVPNVTNAVAPWSLPRFVGGFDLDNDGVPDATDLGPMTEDFLLGRDPQYPTVRILEEPISMPDLRIYLEYYRYEHDDVGGRKGLRDILPVNPSAGDFQAAFFSNSAVRREARVNPYAAPAPITDVLDQEILVIRLVATWSGGGQTELTVCKRRIPRTQ